MDKPVLFLGEWCRLYHRKSVWESLDAAILPYHWNDREKLHRDYLYLQGLYEEMLLELSEHLNFIHGVNHTLRYWRILVGPWLGYFIQILFDRWEMIQLAVTDYPISGVRVLSTVREQVVPNDMAHFARLFEGDAWNAAIYAQLLRCWTTVPVEEVNLTAPSPFLYAQHVLTLGCRLKHKLAHAISIASKMCTHDEEAFFMATYLPIQTDLRLQSCMGQIPKIWSPFQAPRTQVDWTKRQWHIGQSVEAGFPTIVRLMIPQHIPTLYLEGYQALKSLCSTLPWPKKPRIIFTSNSYSSDDVFKAWAAEKVEEGVPLVIGQHGGNYGLSRWGFTEDHQCAISDCWLSWGWDDIKRNHIKPIGNLKMVGINMGWDTEGYALMVEMTMPRYSYHMYSVPVASQWLNYFNDQCRFVDALPDKIRRCLLVRLFMTDYGWDQAARWQNRFPDVCLDDGRAPIARVIKHSRLYISTYNATTYLESLAMNIPTIMFWNPAHWELRDSAISYFDRLKEVGIFHETPESAANQMGRVWNDVSAWWNSKSVQEVRKEFCYRYSRMPEQPLEKLEQVLNQISRLQ